MPFRCPQCRSEASLEITAALELPPDSRSDEIALQVVGCRMCGFRGLAVYEESRRGSLERDDFSHIGYRVSPDAVESVLAAIRSCPQPGNVRCKCEAHTALSRKDVYGVWQGLLEMQHGQTFGMRLAHGTS
jgi:ferredoxin